MSPVSGRLCLIKKARKGGFQAKVEGLGIKGAGL